MKTFIYCSLAFTSLLGSPSFAQTPGARCFRADNPQTIVAHFADGHSERAVFALIRAEDLPGQTNFDTKLETQSGKILLASAIRTSGDERFQNKDRFVVECDGGFLDLYEISTSGKKVLASDRFRASTNECNGANEYLSSAATTFSPVACPRL